MRGLVPRALGLRWAGTLLWAFKRIALAGEDVWGQFSGHQAQLLDRCWSR